MTRLVRRHGVILNLLRRDLGDRDGDACHVGEALLAIRCPGEITAGKLDILRFANEILIEEIRRAGLYDDIW